MKIELNEITLKYSLLRVVELAKGAVSGLNIDNTDDAKKVLTVLANLDKIEEELKDDITYFRNCHTFASFAYSLMTSVNVHPLETLKLQTATVILDALKTAFESRVECM